MRKILYVLLVSTIVFWGFYSYAEWTTDKDKALSELLQERVLLERSTQDFIKAGYKELTATKMLKYLDDKERQLLLNELVDEKVSKEQKEITDSEISTTEKESLILDLEALKETP